MAEMKILIGHMASEAAFPRFIETQRWQRLIGDPVAADHVLISNGDVETKTNQSSMPVIFDSGAERNGLFNLSRMRNNLVRYARDKAYDGLMILESDFVILRGWWHFPKTWAIPFSVYDDPAKLTFPDMPPDYERTVKDVKCWHSQPVRTLIPVHCVMLNCSVFDKAIWDETYEGVGYDDWDFNNVMRNDVGEFESTDCLLLHRWHPSTGASVREANLIHYESKWGKLSV